MAENQLTEKRLEGFFGSVCGALDVHRKQWELPPLDLELDVEALVCLSAAVVSVHGGLVAVLAVALLLHGRKQEVALPTVLCAEQILRILLWLHSEPGET